MKKLIFVHDWIGPKGVFNNERIPHVYDIARKLSSVHVNDNFDFGAGPLIEDIGQHTNNCVAYPTYQIKLLNNKSFLYELQLNFNNVVSDLSDTVGLLDRFPYHHDLIDKIVNDKGYLVISTLFESFLEDYIFSLMHNYFSRKSIPLNKIIYFTNCINGDILYKDFCLRHNQKPEINCEYIGLYLLQQIQDISHPQNIRRLMQKRLKPNKPKVFLNFNRRIRSHRTTFLLKIFKLNLIDKFFISFDRPNNNFLSDCLYLSRKYNIENVDESFVNEITNELPFYLDKKDLNRFPVEDKMVDTMFLYEDSYISIVSETNFENNIIHMTEKTIKPIIFKHPFIIIGPTHSLKYLKSMGFKTFSDFWDESYDDETDAITRMNKIFNLVSDISKWDIEKLNNLERDVQEIVNYNFQNLLKLRSNPIFLNNFINKYGDIL